MRPERYGYEPSNFSCFSLSSMGDEPRNVKEALSGDGASYWKKAMDEEINTLEHNQT